MRLSKAEKMGVIQAYKQPKHCSQCRLATLCSDGKLRCDLTRMDDNCLGSVVCPYNKPCINWQEGGFKYGR